MTRRSRRAVLFVAAIVVAAVLGAGLFVVWLNLPKEPRIVTNDRLMTITTVRLDELDAQLTDLAPIPGTQPPARGRPGCGSDSGEVFQPATTRTWKTRPNENRIAAAALVEALVGKGWNPRGEPDAFGTYELTLDRGDWSARAVVAPLDVDELYLRAQVVGTDPCHGESR